MPKTIMIVDDLVDYTNSLAASLAAVGYGVVVVNDGLQSIQMAKAKKPDLILLDIMMPRIGGTEVRAQLMKEPETRNIPVIFLTGLKAPIQKENSRNFSVPRLSKSEDLKKILETIQEILASAKHA